MKKTNFNNDDLDKVFKEGLNDFQVPPPSFHQPTVDGELDDALRSKLDSFEMQPDEKNWNEIKRRIPLSLKMQRHLNLWSKIAAVLIVGLATSLLVTSYQDYKADMAIDDTEEKPIVPVIPIESDFVFDLQNENSSKDKVEKTETAFDIFNKDEIDMATVQQPIEELPKLESKVLGEVVASDNPLNDKLKREGNIGDMPLQIQKRVDQEMLSLTPEEIKAAGQKKQ